MILFAHTRGRCVPRALYLAARGESRRHQGRADDYALQLVELRHRLEEAAAPAVVVTVAPDCDLCPELTQALHGALARLALVESGTRAQGNTRRFLHALVDWAMAWARRERDRADRAEAALRSHGPDTTDSPVGDVPEIEAVAS